MTEAICPILSALSWHLIMMYIFSFFNSFLANQFLQPYNNFCHSFSDLSPTSNFSTGNWGSKRNFLSWLPHTLLGKKNKQTKLNKKLPNKQTKNNKWQVQRHRSMTTMSMQGSNNKWNIYLQKYKVQKLNSILKILKPAKYSRILYMQHFSSSLGIFF